MAPWTSYALKVFNRLATLSKGLARLSTPMLYALGFIWLVTISGLGGFFLVLISTDLMVHDAYFVVIRFDYVMVGGIVWALLGALHYWWPKMTGRMYSETSARIGFVVSFIGFNLAMVSQAIMGFQGIPRRYSEYKPQFELYQQLTTIGTMILGIGLGLVAYSLIRSLFSGSKDPDKP